MEEAGSARTGSDKTARVCLGGTGHLRILISESEDGRLLSGAQ